MAHYVRLTPGSTSQSTDQFSSQTVQRGLSNVGKRLSRGVVKPDLNRLNQPVGGNVSEQSVNVKFHNADREQFVSHKFGYTVSNFSAESPDKPAKFSLGSSPPNKYGMWIQSDTADVTVRIVMHGQRNGRK